MVSAQGPIAFIDGSMNISRGGKVKTKKTRNKYRPGNMDEQRKGALFGRLIARNTARQ